MTALSADAPFEAMLGPEYDLPMAAVQIFDGSILGYNSSGHVRPFALGDMFAGHARDSIDNSTGTAGGRRMRTLVGRYRGQVALSGVAITDAINRAPVYATDSGTLSLRQGLLVGHVVKYVESGKAIVEFNTEMETLVYAQTVVKADFTDGGGTSGYVDLDMAIPEGSVVEHVQHDVRTGFTGDTSAGATVGYAGSTSAFAGSLSVLAADVLGAKTPVATAYCDADRTPRVTVTGAADFTSISAGEMDVKITFSRRTAV